MGLKDTIRTKSNALVRRETLRLPMCGETIGIRGLMAGEQLRCGAAPEDKQPILFVGLGAEEPGTGKPIWNVNSAEDMQGIAALHGEDMKAIMNGVRRLSGMDKEGEDAAKNSQETLSSSSSSASGTESSPTLSAVV